MATIIVPTAGAAFVGAPFKGPFKGGGVLLGNGRLLELVDLGAGAGSTPPVDVAAVPFFDGWTALVVSGRTGGAVMDGQVLLQEETD